MPEAFHCFHLQFRRWSNKTGQESGMAFRFTWVGGKSKCVCVCPRGWKGVVGYRWSPGPLGSRQGCCWDWVGLKFCQRASISLVCQPCNSQPLTLPHPLMAWVTRPRGWRLVATEVQLRDSGDGNLACDAAVSLEDGARIALAWA